MGGIGTRCSAWLLWAWGRAGFRHDSFLNSFLGFCSIGLCLFFASSVHFNIFLSYFGKAYALEGYFCCWFYGQLGLYLSGYPTFLVFLGTPCWLIWHSLFGRASSFSCQTIELLVYYFIHDFIFFLFLFLCIYSCFRRFYFISLSLCFLFFTDLYNR